MDPDNPVVRLCAQGMQAEAEGRAADARALFEQAWDTARDDYDACVAAHYLARHQPTPALTLHWNRACLRRADLVGDARVTGFYPSLHLNIARAHQDLGESALAREHFTLAASHLAAVPPGPYADWTRFAVADGLRATGALQPRQADGHLSALVAAFCARVDHKALALLLPAYVGDLGTPEDKARVATALHMIHAGRWLPDDEQRTVERALDDLVEAPAADSQPVEEVNGDSVRRSESDVETAWN